MKTLPLLVALLWTSNVVPTQSTGPIVQLETGSVLGTVLQSVNNRPFYAYRGIPFAKPPIDELRFQPPEAISAWNGVFNATQDRNVCPQFFNNEITGDEDCLYNYVYTPSAPNTLTKYPVMAFLHINGWLYNGPTYANWKPQRFMDYNVVVVIVGFRLGPFGFLSTNDNASFGNYGMLDQSLGLQWIQKNIAAFGGDPTKVTLFGSSAGAASVTFHQIAPISRGLFRAAIAESGSSLCPWAIQHHPLKWAKLLASSVNCSINGTTTELVNCLREVPARDLVQQSLNLDSYNYLVLPWVPVVESKDGGRFLTDLPIRYFQRGDLPRIPTMVGVNRNEAYGLYTQNKNLFSSVRNGNFKSDILPTLVQNMTKYQNMIPELSQDVFHEYYNVSNALVSVNSTVQANINLMSDTFFKYGFDLLVQLLSRNYFTVYYYAFNYVGSASINNYIAGNHQITHGDELYYLWYNVTSGGWTKEDQTISDLMLKYWINFATIQNPNGPNLVTWNAVTPALNLSYLEFYNTGVRMKSGYETEAMLFWNEYAPNLVAFETGND